jgi:hypothetical protein
VKYVSDNVCMCMCYSRRKWLKQYRENRRRSNNINILYVCLYVKKIWYALPPSERKYHVEEEEEEIMKCLECHRRRRRKWRKETIERK